MSRSPQLKKRRRTLKKKAAELSTLCGIDVAYVCFEPNGGVDTWPEDPNKVKDIILKYRQVKSVEKYPDSTAAAAPGSSQTYSDVTQNDGGGGEIQEPLKKLQDWLSRHNQLSQEQLAGAYRFADKKIKSIRRRMASLKPDEQTLERRRRRTKDRSEASKLIDFVGSWPASSQPEQTTCRFSDSSPLRIVC